ncbi:hypothetical protein GH714_026521 [Hevea brasiliensis]|uniref:peptidylprolyl isomerase n=1 Tax=Hevea brasiliensis TaxID=3981 RepID=A0A6A6MER6_HEVBR|nr:hypothetical protein GH714_026521 [Hevea brasiliensis]
MNLGLMFRLKKQPCLGPLKDDDVAQDQLLSNGIEVKPGKPHPYHSDNVEGRLYVTQATLGLGSSRERSILQCSVGHKSPIFLCSLLPDRIESCSLNLEFKDELVAFSVIGPRSIHLSGYFVSDEGDHLRDEYESYPFDFCSFDDSGEDIAETESEDSSEFDYGDDDDMMMMMTSLMMMRILKFVIEEIVDDDKPTNGNGQPKRSKKKNNKSNDHEDQNNSQQQIVIRGATDASVLESEDEDGFPVTASQKSEDVVQDLQAEVAVQKEKRGKEIKKKARDGNDDAAGKKRKVKNADEIDDNEKNDLSKDGIHHEEVKQQVSPDGNEHHQRVLNSDADCVHGEDALDEKKRKKKKKNKKKNQDSGKDMIRIKLFQLWEMRPNPLWGLKISNLQANLHRLIVKTLLVFCDSLQKYLECENGLAYYGVSVHYIGKLQKNGKIFDSNVGRAPFKFRLGVGQVIKGWDVGVNGMRIGDKRRLTIPPSMGYGDRGAGGKIPPNSWLVFDVELVNVR